MDMVCQLSMRTLARGALAALAAATVFLFAGGDESALAATATNLVIRADLDCDRVVDGADALIPLRASAELGTDIEDGCTPFGWTVGATRQLCWRYIAAQLVFSYPALLDGDVECGFVPEADWSCESAAGPQLPDAVLMACSPRFGTIPENHPICLIRATSADCGNMGGDGGGDCDLVGDRLTCAGFSCTRNGWCESSLAPVTEGRVSFYCYENHGYYRCRLEKGQEPTLVSTAGHVFSKGDTNCDGRVNVEDALPVLRVASGAPPLSDCLADLPGPTRQLCLDMMLTRELLEPLDGSPEDRHYCGFEETADWDCSPVSVGEPRYVSCGYQHLHVGLPHLCAVSDLSLDCGSIVCSVIDEDEAKCDSLSGEPRSECKRQSENDMRCRSADDVNFRCVQHKRYFHCGL